MANIVDARGKACPLPVIATENALAQHGAPLIVLVDHDMARQSIEELATQHGLSAACDTLDSGAHRIVIQPAAAEVLHQVLASTAADDAVQPLQPMDRPEKTAVVLSSAHLGTGDDLLGAVLMEDFISALTRLTPAPDSILLYNSGAKLSAEGAQTAPHLKILAHKGTQILTCAASLGHYGLPSRPAAGIATTMDAITEALYAASRVIRP